jgi:MFS family permease
LSSTLATLICTPAVPQILSTFHSTNSYDSVVLVSVWELGEIFGPFVIAPLSELHGKLPVWHTANTFFIIFSIATAVSSNLNMVIAFRFLNGLASPYVLGSAIIGDLFPPEERGTGMSIASLMPLIGPSVGPIIGGYVSKALGWRWAFWLVAIATAVVGTLLLLFMRETYVVKILETKTRRLRKETGNQNLTSKYDKGVSAKNLFLQTFLRPMKILMLSPIVTMLSLYLAVVYGYLYIILTTMTEVLEARYDFSEDSAGLAFLGIGMSLSTSSLSLADLFS